MESPKKYIVVLINVLLSHYTSCVLNDTVTISPPGIVSVCNGDPLELTCTITNSGSHVILLWNVTVTSATNPESYDRTIFSSSSGDQKAEIMVNSDSTLLTFSRVSPQNELPLVSRLSISPVQSDLNVLCRDDMTSYSSSVVISVTNGRPIQEIETINVTKEYFENDGVSAELEWAQSDQTYSYHVAVVPDLPLNFSTSTRVWIKVPYNNPHNVSVEVSSCGQHITTVFFKELFYSKCRNPALTDDRIDYVEPTIENNIVTFSCPGELVLNGSNTSTCVRYGEWDPDPKLLTCRGMTTITTGSPQPHFTIVGTIVGSLFGVLVLSIIVVMVSISLLLKGKIKGWTDFKKSKPQLKCVNDVEVSPPHYNGHNNSNINEKGLVYVEIGQSSFNQLQRHQPSIPALDDTPIEYAKINHKSLPDKQTMPQLNDESLIVNLDNLLIQLRPQVGSKWYYFGEAAGIRTDVLDNFAKHCSPKDCIVEMLDYWLRNSVEQPTWKDIANILKAINLQQLAHDIESIHSTGKLPVETDLKWVPPVQDADLNVELKSETPPPIPPKLMISPADVSQDIGHHGQQMMPLCVENEPIPALPPKPIVMNLPPRPPK